LEIRQGPENFKTTTSSTSLPISREHWPLLLALTRCLRYSLNQFFLQKIRSLSTIEETIRRRKVTISDRGASQFVPYHCIPAVHNPREGERMMEGQESKSITTNTNRKVKQQF